ncbi:9751_t:CDS:2 [Acaulospora colombiana]|uniref:9751_t:CDS:1 n=1 Tax=Acaulospora colombiana TaxID=27376 RepID=A0ACA9NT45_9GLOM|nr:9751_t:CDS:2 [Acaulospora colombiana]
MGTPNDEIWPGVSELPDYKSTFPQWSPQPLENIIKNLDEVGLDVVQVSDLICLCASSQPAQPRAQTKGKPPKAASPAPNLYQYARGLRSLGFDMEWKPTFIKGDKPNRVAVIQLSGEEDCLQEILEATNIAKIGVGIEGDADKLRKDWGVDISNLIDLSPMARALDPYWDELDEIRAKEREAERLRKAQELAAEAAAKGESTPTTTDVTSSGAEAGKAKKRRHGDENEQDQRPKRGRALGLAELTDRYLSMQLLKTKSIRRGNWEKKLTPDQLNYAANDAAVAYDIYCHLQQMGASGGHS